MVNWKLLGTICGICAAPFTGGASLAVCAACTGIGYVGGTIAEQVFGNDNRQGNQSSPEAFNLLGKSLEELNKLREDIRKDHQSALEKTQSLEKQLEQNRSKQKNPDLRQKHETEEFLKNQETQILNELRRQRQNTEDLEKKLKDLETAQTNAAINGTNQASNTISSNNWNNFIKGFQPSFTTKLIMAAIAIVIIYLMFIKN